MKGTSLGWVRLSSRAVLTKDWNSISGPMRYSICSGHLFRSFFPNPKDASEIARKSRRI